MTRFLWIGLAVMLLVALGIAGLSTTAFGEAPAPSSIRYDYRMGGQRDPRHGRLHPTPSSIRYDYRTVAGYPHDPAAFTQGLLFADGKLFESTGGYGESSVRIVQLASGRVLRQRALPNNRFGEGLTIVGNHLYQLTWKAGIGMIRDLVTLSVVGEFRYSGEGWGLAANGNELVMSDGSAELRFMDAEDFKEHRRIQVRDGNKPVAGLNELEYVEGDLYANVWPTDRIVILNPANGQVRGWLDLSDILPLVFRGPQTDMLNGIAYDAASGRLFVTGKRWPRVFEIEVTSNRDSQGSASRPPQARKTSAFD